MFHMARRQIVGAKPSQSLSGFHCVELCIDKREELLKGAFQRFVYKSFLARKMPVEAARLHPSFSHRIIDTGVLNATLAKQTGRALKNILVTLCHFFFGNTHKKTFTRTMCLDN